MSRLPPMHADALIPGGIQPNDRVHRLTNDNTCSRCGWTVPHDDVPLMLWFNGGDDLLIYCETCLSLEPPGEEPSS